MNTTVCVLLYGDYPRLAARCLHSLIPILPAVGLRIGMNAVSWRTQQVVQEFTANCRATSCDLYESAENLHKYPMARRLFYDQPSPVATEFVMWFDDDSFLKAASKAWLQEVEAAARGAAMAGSQYVMPFQGRQLGWVKAQPWYTGRDFPVKRAGMPYTTFCTGGWWVIKTAILKQFDWPIPELDHRGGDQMLGALCYQQRLTLKQFTKGVAINADEQGRESKAKRRGYDALPVGYHGLTTPRGKPQDH